MSKILCKAKTKKGTPCQNNPNPSSQFCKIHHSANQPPIQISQQEPEEPPIYIDHSELEMGDLSIHFPNEIIFEILKYLNVFELVQFSMMNRSCMNFVKTYRMIPKDAKMRYEKFIEIFNEKQSIINVEKAMEYYIPVYKEQQLIIYPSRFISMKKIELLIRKGIKVKFKKDHNDNVISWIYNKNELSSFEKDFIQINKGMKHLLVSKMIKWNRRELYLHIENISNYLQEYRMKYPDRIIV
jgi:hypothetical protein